MALVTGGKLDDEQRAILSRASYQAPEELADYCLDLHEASRYDYVRCFDLGVCNPQRMTLRDYKPTCYREGGFCYQRRNLPATKISYHDAEEYCRSRGANIQTVEQWYWATVGGSEKRRYPWGEEPFGPTRVNLCDLACTEDLFFDVCEFEPENFEECEPGYLEKHWKYPWNDGWTFEAPVDSFPAGAGRWGHLHLLANVSEAVIWGGRNDYCDGMADNKSDQPGCRGGGARGGIRCASEPGNGAKPHHAYW